MSYKPILCMDFDGVIHSYSSGWKGARNIPDPPVPGALDFLSAAETVFEVHIYSSRSHQFGGIRAMKRWLHAQTVAHINQIINENKDWASPGREAKYPTLRWINLDAHEPWDLMVREAADRFINAVYWPRHKPPAMISIDDRAMTFTGQWPTISSLQHFKPWNKK